MIQTYNFYLNQSFKEMFMFVITLLSQMIWSLEKLRYVVYNGKYGHLYDISRICNQKNTPTHFKTTECLPNIVFQILAICVYSLMFITGLSLNSLSMYQLVNKIRRKENSMHRNRMNILLMHLAVADLMVIVFQLPLEIAWNASVSWLADDITCRVMVFFR